MLTSGVAHRPGRVPTKRALNFTTQPSVWKLHVSREGRAKRRNFSGPRRERPRLTRERSREKHCVLPRGEVKIVNQVRASRPVPVCLSAWEDPGREFSRHGEFDRANTSKRDYLSDRTAAGGGEAFWFQGPMMTHVVVVVVG